MTQFGAAHRTYDLTDLMAGVARTDRRDALVEKVMLVVLGVMAGGGMGLLAGMAACMSWN